MTVSRNGSGGFQPTPSCRGRPGSTAPAWGTTPISTHALVQRAALCARFVSNRWRFQPTPSCRGRRSRSIGLTLFLQFQPTPSCRGRLFGVRCPPDQRFQPTPSCRGRLVCQHPAAPYCHISTHALVQRAAAEADRALAAGRDFNPRPRAEGGEMPWTRSHTALRFQPTPSCRGRHAVQ